MKRPLLALAILAVLAAGPALAQAPETETLDKCHADGLKAASRAWKDDFQEVARIKATSGKVARYRNILSIRPSANFKQTFVDNLPDEEPCDFLPDTQTYPERYSFEGIYGDVAVVSFSGYEYQAHFLVDLITGARHRVDGDELMSSQNRRYLLVDAMVYDNSPAPLRIFDTKQGLRVVAFPGYGMSKMAWDGVDKLQLSLHRPYDKDAVEAIIEINDIGIRLTVPTRNRVLTARFAPIATSDDLPFGPPTEEAK
jgi:hypothetical protein